ncbi:hypothetical protein CBR_g48985 [Chara braunii]|uniref:F-box domain-containing protein n=1 Tax=Chara braunii TaxID=69332 RepID=A0A388M409_CHABU|nr:hypothetical protein CBR_g48985 [Chara braunii]|eukprot:GBG89276.1 hypothetical protein CBR_g48985 [Chara braunii]
METATITSARSIEQLPEFLLTKILSKLNVRDLVRCALVSKRFSELVWEVQELSFNIRTLGVQMGDGGRAFSSVVIDVVRKMHDLRSLHLSGMDFTTAFLQQCLEHVGPSLQELKLYGMDIIGCSQETTACLLNCIFTHCTSLKNLDAHYKAFNPVDVHTAVMAAGSGDGRTISSTLQRLSIQLRVDNSSNVEDVIDFVSFCPGLQELHLALRCENCDAPIAIEIEKLPMLEVLSVNFGKFDAAHPKTISLNAPSLIDLTVRGAQRIIIKGESCLRKLEMAGGPHLCFPPGVLVDCLCLIGYDEYINFGWDGETLRSILRSNLFQPLTTLVIRDFYASSGQGSGYRPSGSTTDSVNELSVAFQSLSTGTTVSCSSSASAFTAALPGAGNGPKPGARSDLFANGLSFQNLKWLELGGVSVESFLSLNLGQGPDGCLITWPTVLPRIRGVQIDGEFSCLRALLCRLVMFLSEILKSCDSLKSVLVSIYDEHGEASIACQNDADFDLCLRFQDLRALEERFRGVLRLNLHAFDFL